VRRRTDLPAVGGIAERELEVRPREPARPFGPFDQAHSVTFEVIDQAGIRKFSRIEESIKIKVVQV